MFLKNVDLTTALRPSYLPDEVLHFVQDNIGLYEGKFKIPDYQNGQVYLTSHRICYIDNEEPRKRSAAIELKEVDRYEFYAGLFKSSAKITLIPKPSKRSSIQNRQIASLTAPSRSATSSPSRTDSPFHLPTAEPPPKNTGTWICPICFLSNPVPSNFDPQIANEHTPIPPCLSCGVKPSLMHVLKAAIAGATNSSSQVSSTISPVQSLPIRPESISWQDTPPISTTISQPTIKKSTSSYECPRCTFLNHPSLQVCEICGASLVAENTSTGLEEPPPQKVAPGPSLPDLNTSGKDNDESIKLSFRGGGEKIFLERLKMCMTQRKWLLQNAPPVPKPTKVQDVSTNSSGTSTPTGDRVKTVGIAGLEQRRMELRKNNELVIGNAFEDLEALMASAKEIIALAESFARSNGTGDSETSEIANALGLVTTKDMLGTGSNSESLYISELSRNLAEFLTDDSRGVLKKSGGIMTLVDLWAVFNRARGGVELVSPFDFEKAAQLWEQLKLPVRLRRFKSGVLVVQGSDRTDEKTVKALLVWLGDLHSFPPEKEVTWDWQSFGSGVTAQEAAERFGWSIGVAEEELEMAEERGALCREVGMDGLRYWENWIDDTQSPVGIMPYDLSYNAS